MMNKYGIYLIILIVCMAIGLKTAIDTPLARNTVIFEITSSQPGMTELFFDTGTGFSQKQSIPLEIVEADKKTKLEYELPHQTIKFLRWDPVNHNNGAEITLHNATISYYGGEATFDIQFESLIPQNQIKTFNISGKSVEFSVDKGFNDPYLVFTKIPEAPNEPSRLWLIVKGVGFSLLSALLFSIIYRLVVAYFNS